MDRITFMNTSYISDAFFEETNLQEAQKQKDDEQGLNKMFYKTKKMQWLNDFDVKDVKMSCSQEFDLNVQDFFNEYQKQLHFQHGLNLYQNPYKESFEMEELQTPHIDEICMSSQSSSNQISIDEKYDIIPLQKSFMSFGFQSIQKKDAQCLGQQQQENFFIQID